MKEWVCGSYIPCRGVTEEQLSRIDFHKITHIFLAFSVLEREEGLYLPVVESAVAEGIGEIQAQLRRQNADCHLLLSIGGACADYFCQATRSAENRRAFALRCRELTEQYGLCGIDLDWEFPGLPHGGIAACEHCVHDFTLLCEELRAVLGDKLLTSAMGSDHWNRLENDRLNGLLDFVNVMTYDMDDAAHSSMPLTKSAMEGWLSHEISREKLLLGVPFYARCPDEAYNWKGYDGLQQMVRQGKAKRLAFDGQEYIAVDGRLLSVDTPESIAEKREYARQMQFGGIFCWQELTDYNGELRNAMWGGQ